MKAEYDFPVTLQPISTGGVTIDDRMAVVRTDTKQPIGVVSDKYSLLYHKDVIDTFKTGLKGMEYEEKISLTKNGARLFAQYTFPKVKYEVAKGDLVSLRLYTTNSYDGSKMFQLSMGAFRIVCENGMVVGQEFFSLSQRHIGQSSSLKEIFSTPIKDVIAEMVNAFKGSIPTMQKMGSVTLKQRPEELFDNKKLQLPRYLLEIAQVSYMANNEKTAWSYYNSLTQAISHKQRKEGPEGRMNFLREAWHAANRVTV